MQRLSYDGSGRRAQSQASWERILAAAVGLFVVRDCAGTSIADISAAAGVSVPTEACEGGSALGVEAERNRGGAARCLQSDAAELAVLNELPGVRSHAPCSTPPTSRRALRSSRALGGQSTWDVEGRKDCRFDKDGVSPDARLRHGKHLD